MHTENMHAISEVAKFPTSSSEAREGIGGHSWRILSHTMMKHLQSPAGQIKRRGGKAWNFWAQKLCEGRGGHPEFCIPNSPYSLFGCKATLNWNKKPKNSASRIVLYQTGTVFAEQKKEKKKKEVKCDVKQESSGIKRSSLWTAN